MIKKKPKVCLTQIQLFAVTLFVTMVISEVCGAGSKKYFHLYEPTDSSPIITKWNVDEHEKGQYYILEKVDKKGRVTEIEYLDSGKIYAGGEAGTVPRIKYEYRDNKIIESLYQSDGALFNGIEAGGPNRTVYYLNKDLEIQSCSKQFVITEEMKRFYTKKEIEESEKNVAHDSCACVLYFAVSLAKYNGKMPIKKGTTKEKLREIECEYIKGHCL